MKGCAYFLLVWSFAIALCGTAFPQSNNFMYGDVILKNRETVTGIIEWTDGQLLWTDLLQATKTNVSMLRYLSDRQLEGLRNQGGGDGLDWQFLNLWKDKLPERQPEALCQFGNIASVHITGENDAQVYYRSGSKVRVSLTSPEGESAPGITVHGSVTTRLRLSEISRVVFKSTNYNNVTWKRKPLYGTVYTMNGPLTGYIRWDMTKALSSRTLYGKNGEVMAGVKFWDIKRIAKKENGATVTFNSSRTVFLQSTRDVSSASRGIVVTNAEWGRAVVDWKAFKSVVFYDPPADEASFGSFAAPKKIYANVTSSGGRAFRGNCSFDLDEEWNFEPIEGRFNGILYQVPVFNIAAIAPANENSSKVTLISGKELVLAGSNDVSARNWGLIIWLVNSRYQYIPWNEVKEVRFRK